jgi:hypothetical protein
MDIAGVVVRGKYICAQRFVERKPGYIFKRSYKSGCSSSQTPNTNPYVSSDRVFLQYRLCDKLVSVTFVFRFFVCSELSRKFLSDLSFPTQCPIFEGSVSVVCSELSRKFLSDLSFPTQCPIFEGSVSDLVTSVYRRGGLVGGVLTRVFIL